MKITNGEVFIESVNQNPLSCSNNGNSDPNKCYGSMSLGANTSPQLATKPESSNNLLDYADVEQVGNKLVASYSGCSWTYNLVNDDGTFQPLTSAAHKTSSSMAISGIVAVVVGALI